MIEIDEEKTEVATKFAELEKALIILKNKCISENRQGDYENILVVIVANLKDHEIKDPNFISESLHFE